jgi:hypothetical protein
LWSIEGLADGAFAIATKTHHSVLEEVSGTGISLYRLTDDVSPPGPPAWEPRPEPSRTALTAAALRYDDKLGVGLIGDRDALPDIGVVADGLADEILRLAKAAGAATASRHVVAA